MTGDMDYMRSMLVQWLDNGIHKIYFNPGFWPSLSMLPLRVDADPKDDEETDDEQGPEEEGEPYDLQDIYGVGPVTAKKLYDGGYESVEDIAAAEPSELSERCGLSIGKAESIIDSANDLLYGDDDDPDDDFDDETRFAMHDIREDFARHLNLASGRQNAMITIVGILVAFASLLFIDIYPKGGFHDLNGFESASAVAMLICCAVGIITLLFWKGDKVLHGNINDAIGKFNEEEWYEVQRELMVGLNHSYVETHVENWFLSKIIKVMAFIILLGLIMMIMGRA
jgi:hypothetical protein